MQLPLDTIALIERALQLPPAVPTVASPAEDLSWRDEVLTGLPDKRGCTVKDLDDDELRHAIFFCHRETGFRQGETRQLSLAGQTNNVSVKFRLVYPILLQEANYRRLSWTE